jgi:hypothetical protein
MDPGTISAIVALAVALIALLVAFAQVAQQYVSTAQLMRKCDSIVFGSLPGGGKRIWVGRQLRFKVVYSMPQISIDARLWALNPVQPAGYLDDGIVTKDVLPELDAQPKSTLSSRKLGGKRQKPDDVETPRNDSVEAPWASFCRTCQPSCGHSLHFQMVKGDADRCPDDLPVIPMQVSFRDVIVMALRSGMRIVNGTQFSSGLTLRGKAGIITSAQHPILGLILHFTPRGPGDDFGLNIDKTVSPAWMARLWGDCSVAKGQFTKRERRFEEKLLFSRLQSSGKKHSPGEGVGGENKPFLSRREIGVAFGDRVRAREAGSTRYDTILRGDEDGQWSIEPPQVDPEKTGERETSQKFAPDVVKRAGASKIQEEFAAKDPPSVPLHEIPSNSMPEGSKNRDTSAPLDEKAMYKDVNAMNSLLRGPLHVNKSTAASTNPESANRDMQMEPQARGESKLNQDHNTAVQGEKASGEKRIDREWALVLRSPPMPLKDLHPVTSNRLPDSNKKDMKPSGKGMVQQSPKSLPQEEPKASKKDENLQGLDKPLETPRNNPGNPEVDRLGLNNAENLKQTSQKPDAPVTEPTASQNPPTRKPLEFPSDPIGSTSTSKRRTGRHRHKPKDDLGRRLSAEHLELERLQYKEKKKEIKAEIADQARRRRIASLELFIAESAQRRKYNEIVARERLEADQEQFGRVQQTSRLRAQFCEEQRMRELEIGVKLEKEEFLLKTQARRMKREENAKLWKDKEKLKERVEPIYLSDPEGNRFKLPFRRFKRSRVSLQRSLNK